MALKLSEGSTLQINKCLADHRLVLTTTALNIEHHRDRSTTRNPLGYLPREVLH